MAKRADSQKGVPHGASQGMMMADEGKSFFPLDIPPLTDELVGRFQNQLTLGEREKQKAEDLKSLLLRDAELNFPKDGNFLLQFLRVRKFDSERAATLCKNLFRKLHVCKLLYGNVDVPSLVRKIADGKSIGILPNRDKDGCVAIMVSAGLWDPQKVLAQEFQLALVLTVLQCIRSPLTQITGFKLIIDYSGFSFFQMMHISPRLVWHFMDSVQNCIPCPVKAAYIVNENAVFTHLWSILRHLVKMKIRKRCHFLGSDLQELNEAFPPSTLPEQLGGTAGPFSTKPWLQLMQDCDQYYEFIRRHGYGGKEKAAS